MSHLIEEYAKNLGVKIATPMVAKHFWPIPFDNYITIYLEDKAQSKSYKYYELVIDMIKPYLAKNNIKIIQLGSAKSPKLNNADARFFDLSFKNNSYILSKAKLHIGVDNVFSHFASSQKIPLVTIFGNVYSSIARGYWSKNQINIEAPWKVKPSLNVTDAADSINKIKPETIASAILKQLSINSPIALETQYIGDFYSNPVLELVPDFFAPWQDMRSQLVFMRLDYDLDNACFINWSNFLNAFILFSKQLLPLNYCMQFQNKIKGISYLISKEADIPHEHLKQLASLNIPVTLLVEDENHLSELREHYFDSNVQLYFKASKNALPESCRDFKDLYFNSSKVLISKGEKYPSKYHWQQQKNFVDKNFNLEDNEDLLAELNHFYVYTRTKQ